MTTLGKYELHEQLGRGGFGTVYRATDTTLDREVALKILHPQLTTDPEFLNRFRNEARLVASLDSPHIVTIYEMGEIEGRVFIAMKYLPGGSLYDRLQKSGPLPFPEAARIMDEVCLGLASAHKKSLVHRDLKPSNILFDADGRAVIGDFGLARAVHVSSSTTTSSTGGVGTPAYRAPELWLGKPPVSPATDIYSLGCVFSEILTGKVLFNGDTTEEILTKHLITGPDIPENYPVGTPANIRSIIQRMVAKDSSQRFLDATVFIQDIKPYLHTVVVPQIPSPIPPPPVETRKPIPLTRPPASTIPQPIPAPKAEPVITPHKSNSIWVGIGFAMIGLVLFLTLGFVTDWFGLKEPKTQIPSFDNGSSVIETTQAPVYVPQIKEAPLYVPPVTEEPVIQQPVDQITNTPIVIVVTSTPPQQPSDSTSGMELIPGGTFNMGATDDEMQWHLDSCNYYATCNIVDYTDMQPQHTIKIDPFYMDIHEVTNAEYRACVEAGFCSQPSQTKIAKFLDDNYYSNMRNADYPVVGVNWGDAVAYCKWNGNKRLPTEAEWEFAASGGKHWFFPWLKTPSGLSANSVFGGSTPLSNYCDVNCVMKTWKDEKMNDGWAGPAPVMSFLVGFFGLFDMSGNVSEWIQDKYAADFYNRSNFENPVNQSGDYHMTRGGGWNNGIYHSSSLFRTGQDRNDSTAYIGFRCVKDPQ
ncbi:MAG TPA: bifunctional serine/threonine-protein kinase/formylglycine-generating enzyme family protein [Anaerolineaceae bacterium]|nr:bifunctional serine/threonine-protein kinase/formylglycine-generating enzyme family protein [Anaerolineaceae bacterium]